jgi:2-polyprenyl-3-methyl-5-hydroxy-6-metoxy-1,4-benzoquinol methylase
MFSRDDQTYVVRDESVDAVLRDAANPLFQIVEMISTFEGDPQVLDIGAGNGLLARLLARKSQRGIIDGIESNPYAADIASPHYRDFYRGHAREFLEVIEKNRYDFIVLADVIEHMEDPFRFLKELRSHVSGSTRVLISTPNVAFGSVRIGLMNGEFRYVDSGLLERTHLRFFTYETLRELVRECGFHDLETLFLLRGYWETEIEISPSLKNLLYLLSIRNDRLAPVYQFLIVLGSEPDDRRPEAPIRIGRPSRVMADFVTRFWERLKHRARPGPKA